MRFGCKGHQTLEIFCVNLKNDMKAARNNTPRGLPEWHANANKQFAGLASDMWGCQRAHILRPRRSPRRTSYLYLRGCKVFLKDD